MSLIIRRKATPAPGRQAVDGVVVKFPDRGELIVRVIKVDPDGTVHLAFIADRSVSILREELLDGDNQKKVFRYQRKEAGGE